MLAAVVAALIVPWTAPLSFAALAPGWHVGRSGTVYSVAVGGGRRLRARTPISTAWTANFRYRDRATSDPPNKTLRRLPRTGIVVWAEIEPATRFPFPPDRRRATRRYVLADAYTFACCEGACAHVPGGEWKLYGWGPKRAYTVLIRIYFGSRPSRAMKMKAQRALDRLRLPRARS